MVARSLALVGGAAFLIAPFTVSSSPNFSVPFGCGQTWTGATRTSHHPPHAIDFNRADDEGDVVVASEAGRVVEIDRTHVSYGRLVVIDHGDGWESYSAHLELITVQVGDLVQRGDPIGTVGDTGHSDGAHLHYEQRLHQRPVRTVFNGRESRTQATKTFRTDSC